MDLLIRTMEDGNTQEAGGYYFISYLIRIDAN
jgi:hypothetical protein